MLGRRAQVLLFFTFLYSAQGFFVRVKKAQEICFVEDVPGQEMSVGKYDSPDSGSPGFPEITITVTDPAGSVILTQTAKKSGALNVRHSCIN